MNEIKSNQIKSNKIKLLFAAFLFASATAILLKHSTNRDPEVSNSVKEELRKSVESFQVPKLKIQSMVVQIQSEFQGKKDLPKIEVHYFKSVDTLYILKEGQDGAKELSLLGFFQLWQLSNAGLHKRVLVEVNLPNLSNLERPNTIFSFREKYRTEIKSENHYAEYLSTCKTGKVMQASEIHKNIPGNAIMITCKTKLEGTPGSKSRGYYFPSLGWYFVTDFENDFYKGKYEIISVILSQ
ncbi:hypothetical protein LFX25_03440 [Leptospira sp. FAT2]|uniref:hypothetical protein n=1 Tax=Leptospira sanjuanensis TaxID=2879643 RepID=UPI001EE92D3A|nr:hypothetical protein [Leptospira sanjuanensis]MCG6192293.1 hypothetical protein [Leptospira sanjuanensis]